MKTVISYEEAKQVIDEFSDEDEYVQAHYQLFLGFDGEPNDNTCETSYYWRRCQEIVKNNQPIK